MAKSKDNNSGQGTAVSDQKAEEILDLESLWKMKFRDSRTGEISMIRKAFKPRGKLEFYQPSEDQK